MSSEYPVVLLLAPFSYRSSASLVDESGKKAEACEIHPVFPKADCYLAFWSLLARGDPNPVFYKADPIRRVEVGFILLTPPRESGR